MTKAEHLYKPVSVRKYVYLTNVFIELRCDCGKKDWGVKPEEQLTNEEKEIYVR